MMNAVFWDVIPCGSSKNQRFGVAYPLHNQVRMSQVDKRNVTSN
jgi:hypothetical protein